MKSFVRLKALRGNYNNLTGGGIFLTCFSDDNLMIFFGKALNTRFLLSDRERLSLTLESFI